MSGQRDKEIGQEIEGKVNYVTASVAGASTAGQNILLTKEPDPDGSSRVVQCDACKEILQNENTSGASTLTGHVCKTSRGPLTSNASISAEDAETIMKGCINYCTKDLRSFNGISGPGFKSLAEELMNFGFKYGCVPAEHVLPGATKVSRRLLELAEKVKHNILPEIIDAIRRGICAATISSYIYKDTKTSYDIVIVHYVNDSWKLIARELFTMVFPEETSSESKSSELIRRFGAFGIPTDIIHKITFVTNWRSNIIKTSNPVEQLNCAVCCISSVLDAALSKLRLMHKTPNISHILETTESIVAYLKSSGLDSHLTGGVHQRWSNLWYGNIAILRPFLEQYDSISEVLPIAEKNKLKNYNVNRAQQLLTFLKPFEQCFEILRANKSPTLHLVLLCVQKLLKHCETNNTDNIEIQHLKNGTKICLQNVFKLHKYQTIATFLVPTFRKLYMLSKEERTAVKENIKELISHMSKDCISQKLSTSIPTPTTTTEQPPEKRLKTLFPEWADSDEELEHTELTKYMSLNGMANDDILQWWKDNMCKLPQLSMVAKKIFAIPASTMLTKSDRFFEFMNQERNSCLAPEVLDAILLVHNNM